MKKYKGYEIRITPSLLNYNKQQVFIKNEELNVEYCNEFSNISNIKEVEDYAESIIDFAELVRSVAKKD